MTRILALIALAALAPLGCKDSSPAKSDASAQAGDAGGAGDGGGLSATTQCRGTFAAVNRGVLGAVSKPPGKCAMPADLDIICANDVGMTTRACGANCYGANTMATEVALVMCTSDCVNKMLKPNLGADCQSCYSAATACTISKCLLPCAADSMSAACVTCQTTQGCLPMFFACSGLPAPQASGDAGTPRAADARPASSDASAPDAGGAGADAVTGAADMRSTAADAGARAADTRAPADAATGADAAALGSADAASGG
jgi:hypothetical protein